MAASPSGELTDVIDEKLEFADETNVPFDILDIRDNELDIYGSFRYKNTY
ncbi:hypothetical protein [Halogranum rubrum]|uniref:Uncharacterized protein n=1 Tax=Halogranum salarium B-1 TaxID=1210908 RepID=J3JDJ4_9EURY|nr:hypothetical protein [Halogranum salarium]EJN57541.1 hypothetical protein HSB1_42290 [Halogranum salarium B-1]